MIRAAVIGVGSMGRNHARVYGLLTNVELVAVADTDAPVLENVVRENGVRGYESYCDLLKREQPDVVSVVVPTRLHRRVTIDALESGSHVLVEKPIAATIEEAEDMIDCARRKGLGLMVGHIERFNPVVVALKSALKGEAVISISITRVGPLPLRIQDVGVIIDLGTHDIDLVRFLTDAEFEEVHALSSIANVRHEDMALMIFRMSNGVLAQITSNWLTPYKEREIVVCTRHHQFRANLMTQQLIEYSNYNADSGAYQVKHWPVSQAEPLQRELAAFVEAVVNRTPPPVTAEDGMVALSIAYRCLSSVSPVKS